MSEGEQTNETIAEGYAPEFAVVGEPASEPHQAVVVGEPVPLANGHPAIPPPRAEEPAVYGVQEVSHLHHHQDVHDQEECSEERPTSSESSAEVNSSPSEGPAEENPNTPSAPADETPSPSDAPVEETPSATAEETSSGPDAPAEENHSVAEERNATVPPADAAEASNTADVSAESPDPVEVSPEVPIENPYFPLEETSNAVLERESVTGSKVSEAAQEEALTEPSQISERDASLQEAVASDIVPEKPIDEQAKEIDLTEEVPSVEGTKIIESHGAESHAREPDEALYDGSSVDPSLEVARVTCEEVTQPEGSTNADQIPQKDPLHEDTSLLDSHQVQNQSHVEALVTSTFETPIPSQTTRKIMVEDNTPGQSPSEKPLVEETTLKQTPLEGAESLQDNVPAAIGDNGFQSVEDDNHVVEREQDFSKDDENAEGKEKPSSRIRLPLIVAGLAIAAVGVAVASISRTH